MTLHKISDSARFGGSAALLAVGVLVLAGCAGGSPNQGASPDATHSSASVSATPTPTATPTAVYRPADASGPAQNVPVPVLPDVGKTETKEGLEAFAKYWFEQLNYAYETGDIAGVQKITAPNCRYCSNITRSLTTNYQGGRWLAGGKLSTPVATTTFERGEDGNYQIILQVQQDEIRYYQEEGLEFRAATQPSNTGNVLLVAFQKSAWRVAGLHPLR